MNKTAWTLLVAFGSLVFSACGTGEAKSPDGQGTICHVNETKSCVVARQKEGNGCACDGQPGYVRFDH